MTKKELYKTQNRLEIKTDPKIYSLTTSPLGLFYKYSNYTILLPTYLM